MANKSKTGRKSLIELGIGIVSLVATDAILNTVKTLEKEGKFNKKDTDKILKEVSKKYKLVTTKYSKDLQSQLDRLVKEGSKANPFVTKKDLEELRAKMEKLDKSLKKSRK